MPQPDLSQDPDYQREHTRYQQLLRRQELLVNAGPADRKAATEALDLQMMRLQVAELRCQAAQAEQAPRELAAVRDQTLLFLEKSRRMATRRLGNDETFRARIEQTQARIAESQQLLNLLKTKAFPLPHTPVQPHFLE